MINVKKDYCLFLFREVIGRKGQEDVNNIRDEKDFDLIAKKESDTANRVII